MAEPTSDPDRDPPRQPPRPAGRRLERLADIGLEAASLTMLSFIAAGLLVHAGRREISRQLAEAWLSERGVEAVLDVDSLDASGFSGAIRLGPRSDPIFAADRIEVAYDLTTPWLKGGGPFAIDTRAVRLTRPRLKASLTDQGLNLGALQPLIDEMLRAPAKPGARGPAVLVENARLDLRTPGGLARITGDASLDDGKLLRFDGRLAPMRYNTPALVIEARGALLSARKRGERLTLTARFDLEALTRDDLDLQDAQGQIDADLSYPDLARLAAPGPAELRLALKADAARAGQARARELAADLTLAGLLDGTLSRGSFTGRLTGQAHGDELAAPGVSARGVGLDLDLPSLSATARDDALSVRAAGQVSAELDQALAGGAALRGAAGRIESGGLVLTTDKAGGTISGPLALQLGAGRLASGGLALTSLAASARGQISGPLAKPGLTLNGAASADSGVSGPDAERLAAGLPNPAYARSAAQALRTFALDAPSVSLSVADGRARIGLPRPIRLEAPGGARAQIAAAGGPLLDASGGLARGGLVASLGGGGLPTLRLDVPDWRASDGDLTARLTLAAEQLDLPPLEGAAGQIAGRVRLTGSRLSFALDGCAPLSAARVRVGETILSDQKATLCPAEGPLVSAANGAWSAQARFRDLGSLLDEAQASLSEGAGGLTAGGTGGLDRAEIQLDQAVLRDTAKDRRFNPVRTKGRLALAGGLWTGAIDAATQTGLPLGRITLRHEVARERGRAEIDASRLLFAKDGLQPGDLSPLAAFAKQSKGPAGFTGAFAWDAKGLTSHGRLVVDKLDFTSPIGFVATLEGAVDFTSLTPLVSALDQTLRVTRIDSIVPLEAVGAAFTLGAEVLHVSSAAFDAAKGRISIEPTDVPLDPDKPIRGVIVVAHLDLGELIAASSLVEKVQLNAVVDGRLPFELSAKGFRFLDGRIAAIQPGRLSIAREALSGVQTGAGDSPGAPAPPVNAIQDFAYQAMEAMAFDTLEARVNSTDQGRLAVLFHIKGEHDPKVPEKARIGVLDLLRGQAFNKRIALPARTPVDLTLDTSLNFDELLEAWRRSYKGEDPDAPRSAPVQP